MAGKPNDKWLKTMIEKHGSREAVTMVMQRQGAKGGRNGNTGGFAADVMCFCDEFEWAHQVRQCAGKKGGRVSRRKKNG